MARYKSNQGFPAPLKKQFCLLTCSFSFPYSHLFRPGDALAHLDSLPNHDLVIWAYSSVLFLSTKNTPTPLTAYLVLLRQPFSVCLIQFVQIFLLNLAPFCKLFTGISSNINKSATSLLFSLYYTFALFLLHSSFSHSLKHLTETICFLFFLCSQDTVGTLSLISPGNNKPNKLARLYLSYLLYPLISSFRQEAYYQNVSTHKSLQYLLKNSCCFITLAEFSFAYGLR